MKNKKGILIACALVFLVFVPQINALLINSAHSPPLSFCIEQNTALSCQDQTWSKTLGKLLSSEEGFSVQQLNDGKYIVIGNADHENGDTWLVKMDTEGNIEWETHLGGKGRYVEETNDGGFIIATRGTRLLKTDADGNEVWSREYPGYMCGDRLVQQTEDQGYILIASKDNNQQALLIKTDGNGNELWNRTYGGKKHDMGGSVQQTTDGGYIFTGLTSSYGIEESGKNKIWLVKTDSEGIEEWNTTLGAEGYVSRGFSVQQCSDGGYAVGGISAQGGCLIKTDRQGKTEWKTYFDEYECTAIYSVQQTADGGYILTGTSGGDFYVDSNLYLIKVDQHGAVQLVKIFGRPSYCEYGNCVRQTSDGGYIVTGVKQRFKVYAGIAPLCLDMWVIKTDEQGKSDNVNYLRHPCFL